MTGSEPDDAARLAPSPDDIRGLTIELHEATAAARNAYRDTGRLIRLLAVLSDPSAPDELLERALAVLSESFNADVVCVVSVVSDRYLVTSDRGLPEDDRSYRDGWTLGEAAAAAVAGRQPVAIRIEPSSPDVPASIADLHLRTAAFVPMSANSEPSDEMLVLYRSSGEPFADTDLHVLASVAYRLRIAAQDRERAKAIERLAQSGQLLAPHLEVESLISNAAELIQRLTAADDAWILDIVGTRAVLRAHHGQAPPQSTALAGRPVTKLRAWPTAVAGQPWSTTAATWSDTGPHTVLSIPVMRDGEPIYLIYVSRNGPRPFGAEITEIATIFASNLGTALENAELYHELRRQAARDPLTGLANRERARQRLEHVLTAGPSPYIGLLFCDLDGFKAVNDRLGHEAGDELLKLVAARLQMALRTGDLLARFGGDEFVAVLSGVENLDEVSDIGRSLVDVLAEPFTLDTERVTVSASIGGVLGARGETTAGTMLRDADAAMYVAKSRGTGVVEVFDDAASHRSLDRLSIRSELVRALDRREFEVLYQPIVELDTARPVGFEALLRWTHPERGPIPPDVFIPLAEETGKIVSIGTWVLEQACQQLADWQRLPGWNLLNLNVNLSAAQLCEPNVTEQVSSMMRRVGVNPHDVWLEVTEKRHAGDDVTDATQSLRGIGVHFALDDFGSYYSNLAYLKQFPAECLKIDGSFIDGVATEGTDRSIVLAILAMAKSLDLEVVAEGVETAAQRDTLIALGCRLGQGYLYAPALTAKAATALLRDVASRDGLAVDVAGDALPGACVSVRGR